MESRDKPPGLYGLEESINKARVCPVAGPRKGDGIAQRSMSVEKWDGKKEENLYQLDIKRMYPPKRAVVVPETGNRV
jgi:hypothetical protein